MISPKKSFYQNTDGTMIYSLSYNLHCCHFKPEIYLPYLVHLSQIWWKDILIMAKERSYL